MTSSTIARGDDRALVVVPFGRGTLTRARPARLCACGCGNPTSIAAYTNPRKGHVQGEPLRFIRNHHLRTPEVRAKQRVSVSLQNDWTFRGVKDLRGQVFGRLRVRYIAPRTLWGKSDRASWICACDCGEEKIAQGDNLRSGHTVTCGNHHGENQPRGPESHLWKGTPEERFAQYVGERDSNGCLLWLGRVDADGYGRFKAERTVMAHRFAYEAQIGPIPDGLHLHHRCGNRRCLSPEHLVPLEPSEHRRLHVAESAE